MLQFQAYISTGNTHTHTPNELMQATNEPMLESTTTLLFSSSPPIRTQIFFYMHVKRSRTVCVVAAAAFFATRFILISTWASFVCTICFRMALFTPVPPLQIHWIKLFRLSLDFHSNEWSVYSFPVFFLSLSLSHSLIFHIVPAFFPLRPRMNISKNL